MRGELLANGLEVVHRLEGENLAPLRLRIGMRFAGFSSTRRARTG
jgi:hypothetical protein